MPAEKSHRFKGRHDAKKEQYGQIYGSQLSDVYSEVTGKPLQESLYQYMSDASLSLSEMEPYFSYYPDKLYKNLVETRVIYNGILAQ